MKRTPQEKKRLSYSKDRRNTFGENSKASRKGIPLAKARANRAERHTQGRLLSTANCAVEEDEMTYVEVQVKSVKPRQWRKTPDKPLGVVLARKRAKRSLNREP